jgi:hypothetical protein
MGYIAGIADRLGYYASIFKEPFSSAEDKKLRKAILSNVAIRASGAARNKEGLKLPFAKYCPANRSDPRHGIARSFKARSLMHLTNGWRSTGSAVAEEAVSLKNR